MIVLSPRLATALVLALLLAGCASFRPAAETHVASLTAFRVAHGLSPANPDPALQAMAAQQARFMAEAGRMTHTTGPGRDFASRLRMNDVHGVAAENVASNADDPGRALVLWANSPPHRRNMLEPRFAHYGLASATDASGRRYWALDLAQ